MKSISIFPYPECSDSVQYKYKMSSSQIDQVTCPLRPFQWLILVLAVGQLVQDTSSYKIMEQKFMVNSESSSPFHHMRILMSLQEEKKVINKCHTDVKIRGRCERCSKATRSTGAFMDCCKSNQETYCEILLKNIPSEPSKESMRPLKMRRNKSFGLMGN